MTAEVARDGAENASGPSSDRAHSGGPRPFSPPRRLTTMHVAATVHHVHVDPDTCRPSSHALMIRAESFGLWTGGSRPPCGSAGDGPLMPRFRISCRFMCGSRRRTESGRRVPPRGPDWAGGAGFLALVRAVNLRGLSSTVGCANIRWNRSVAHGRAIVKCVFVMSWVRICLTGIAPRFRCPRGVL